MPVAEIPYTIIAIENMDELMVLYHALTIYQRREEFSKNYGSAKRAQELADKVKTEIKHSKEAELNG